MSWGHATSTDLVDWTEQPVAIACDESEDIFSGSIVWDEDNTSGFGDRARCASGGHLYQRVQEGLNSFGRQAQSLAWSTDGGYNWTKYLENPVLDRKSANFRDPKVFRYPARLAVTGLWSRSKLTTTPWSSTVP